MDRRQFTGALVGLTAAASAAQPASAAASARALFYVGVGPALCGYGVDAATRRLVLKQGPYTLPSIVQGAWQNPRTGHLYVAWSEGLDGMRHGLAAFAVNRDGGLSPAGPSFPLPQRPIHITVDAEGAYVLAAYPRPPGVAVFRITPDGTLAGEVAQQATLDLGVYPHEVRVLPSNRAVSISARGVTGTANAPEQPGSIRLYRFSGGQLTPLQTLAPNGGMDFRPRNLEFAPSGRFVFAALEGQNRLDVFPLDGDRLGETALFGETTLARPAGGPGQILSVSRLHPNGRVLYIVNRGYPTERVEGQGVISGGEDSVAVFALDPASGRPRLIQVAPLPAVQARGIGLFPDGRWLAVAGLNAGRKRTAAGAIEDVPAAASLYAIAADGRLTFANRTPYPAPTGDAVWAGVVRY